MLFNKSSNIYTRLFLLVLVLLLAFNPTQAQNKKKKKYSKKKSDANIIARGYNDVTTRNNYYFNSQVIYKDILSSVEQSTDINYDEILPIYFHQKISDFEAFSAELESIIKKTSEAMQLHDNTRWKDNVYLLLGKARYLSGDYEEALKTFQFVVTTMKEDVAKKKGKVDNKAIAKSKKAKEAAKAAEQRKKEIAKKKAEIKAQFQKLKRDKEKEIAAKNKARKKALEKKIKAKKKVIALRKKGKKPSQKLLDIANGKTSNDENEIVENTEQEEKKEEEKEKTSEKIVTVKTDYRSDKKIERQKAAEEARELAALNDTLPMTEKEIKRYNDLSLWQKIRHKRSRSEAIVWMAKSYLALGEFENAQSMLEYADALPKLTRKQRLDVYVGEVYYYIERERYDNAIEALDNAILFAKKKEKAKYRFVKAQLQEKKESPAQAIDTYQEVAEGKANYEMKFYANMKIASIYESENLATNEEVIELLTKVLKNGSNREFRDQIHYSIASIYAKEGDLEMTKSHLQSSITDSRNNPLQKGLSFKELGEVYFTQENYEAAKIFFDSAVALIPKDFNEFENIKFKGETITAIAAEAAIIAEQDSLLMLSKFSDEDMELYLAELEKKNRVVNVGKRRKQKSVTDFIDEAVAATPGATGFNTGEWYFYNSSLKTQGYTTFKDIWGDRPLEPNWRRIEKQSLFEANDDDAPLQIQPFPEEEKKPVKKELKIPKTDEEIAASKQKLYDAHYEFAKLFRNQLEINGEAKQSFETIVNEYVEFKSIDRVYYYLYLIYSEEGDLARAEHFKKILMDEYPVSQYAVAFNTTYTFDRDNEQPRPDPVGIEKLYVSTYSSFLDGAYQEVIDRRKEAYDTYKENALMPKFDFLEALSYGHLDSIVVLKSKLSTIISKYPNHEVEEKAREYLAYLNQKEKEESVPTDTTIIETDTGSVELVTIYSNEESNNVFGMVVLKNKNSDVRTMIQVLEQYNNNNFAARKLRVSNAFLDKNTPMILIKRFREKSLAIEYYNEVYNSLAEIFGDEANNLELLMISQENFRTLFTTKKINEYRQFFNQTYSQ